MDQPETNDTAPPAQFEPGHLMTPEKWDCIKAEMGEQQE